MQDAVVLAGPDRHRAARQDETYYCLDRIEREGTEALHRGRNSTFDRLLHAVRTMTEDARAAIRTVTCGRHSDVHVQHRGHRGHPPPPSPSAPPSAPPSARPSHSASRRSYGRSASMRLGPQHLRRDNTLLQPSSSRGRRSTCEGTTLCFSRRHHGGRQSTCQGTTLCFNRRHHGGRLSIRLPR